MMTETRETISLMIEDWIADNAEEMEDLVVDGLQPNEDAIQWEAICHDDNARYVLTFVGGDVRMNYISSNK